MDFSRASREKHSPRGGERWEGEDDAMAVWLIAALEALIYLGAVPLHLAATARLDGAAAFGVGFSAFGGRAARRRAAEAMKRPRRKGRAAGRGALRALRKLRPKRLALRGRVGLGDAAATALACGALESLGAALRGVAGTVSVRVRPAFDAQDITVELQGMISATAGQIMLAAARGGMEIITGRIAQWRSIPSKTS